MKITLHIREKRLAKLWSQEELAGRAGISSCCLRYAETGRNSPGIITLCLIAKALDCTLDELVTFE